MNNNSDRCLENPSQEWILWTTYWRLIQLWTRKTKGITLPLGAAYLKLSVLLTHLNEGKEILLENLFIHVKVFKQQIYPETHL